MSEKLKKIQVSAIFSSVNYLVPIYQRNYAWSETQIEQLIEDIESSKGNYFLGNLIVNQKFNNVYEVIDGQQRLTTLYLLEKCLKLEFDKKALQFEAREKSNRTLAYISDISNDQELIKNLSSDEELSSEILNGFKIIYNYFENKKIDKDTFSEKLKHVFLIRVQVPENIDLNHYFEIMNTRGEQLELHEIVKAKLLETLKSDEDKNVAALIWEKCSDMNSYVQMNFNVNMRKSIFTDNWSNLKKSINNFDGIVKSFNQNNINNSENLTKNNYENKSLLDILEENKMINESTSQSQDENERFESIISFPNFLLQVNAVMKKLEEDASIDDKNFIDKLSWSWETQKNAKDFLFHLLKCRVLFDKYVLKREFARDYMETGKWSLQRLEKYRDNEKNGDKPKYVGTFDEKNNKQLRTLQSCLRITYTSPKTMHWITVVLSKLLENEASDIIDVLEEYCSNKVEKPNLQSSKGFEFERIVFSYLDYLIYRDGYPNNNESVNEKKIISPMQEDWQFQFRNSIEHFHPQHPIEGETWEREALNGFGNLALITVSGNSKFSNLSPKSKIDSYPSIINQSLKLKIMKKITEDGDEGWTTTKAENHEKEMFKILKKDCESDE